MSKLYLETPISELPEKDGIYCLIRNNSELRGVVPFSNGRWSVMYSDIISWLKPVSKDEYDQEIARKAWGASINYFRLIRSAPDMETYLNNLNK